MRKPTLTILFLVAFISVIILLRDPLREIVAVSLITAFIVYGLVEQYRLAKRQIEGEFIIRRQKVKVRLGLVLIVILQILSIIADDTLSFLKFSSTFLIIVFIIILKLIVEKYKPMNLAVNGTSLIANYAQTVTHDLTQLTRMRLLGFSNDLILTFKSGKTVSINRDEYLHSDIQKLIAICKETSQEQLEVSDNLINDGNG